MSVQGVISAPVEALYPPTAPAAAQPLALPRFLARFVRNPLRSLPRQAYEEAIIVRRSRLSSAAWVMEPALIERILLTEADRFPKSPIERRVFADSLGDGILTSSGPSWRWQRRTAAPLFRPQALIDTVPLMSAAAAEQLARWSAVPPGAMHAIDSDMTDTTFRALIDVMFSGDGRGEAAAIKRAGTAFLERITWEIASGIVGLPRWMWHPAKRQMREAAGELRAIVATLIARRRQDGRARDDLLGRLMSARDPETGEPMQESQLIDNALTFLAAGHETTAKALTWTLYLLARAPDWQERLRAEVISVAGSDPIQGTHIESLEVTRRVIKEAMRLYPPAPFISRYTPEGATLAGETLPPGTVIVMPVFAIHRHRKLWDDPDRFDPDRFLPEAEARHVRTQFMPFGFGPRICIGASFAMLEATAILATLVRGARFTWDGRHLPEPVSRVTLKPKGGMPLGVEVFQGSLR